MKKFVAKLLSIFVVCIILVNSGSDASAIVNVPIGTTVKSSCLGASNDYPYGYYAYMTTSYYTEETVPITSSQAEHKAGATTTLGVQAAVTKQSFASASLGCSATAELGVNLADLANGSLAGTLSATLEIGESVSYTVGVNVSYTLGENVEPGLYRLVIIFPRKTVLKQVVGVSPQNVETVLWSERVTYAPRLNDAYWSWESYEIGN